MPRYARMMSKSGIYHVILRGNERKDIFLDNEDRLRFLDTLRRMKEAGEYHIYAYCLMTNHVHLLIREGTESVQRSIKRIGISYVYYFNKKYKRIGHLFHDRYRSEIVENDQYILEAVRYIHNNPVKAEMVSKVEDYKWSSWMSYVNENRNKDNLIDTSFILSMFSENHFNSIKLFIEFSENYGNEMFSEHDESPNKRLDEDKNNTRDVIAKILAKHMLRIENFKTFKDKKQRNKMIKEIKENTNTSVREISRLLGISKDIIFRA